MPRSSRRKRRFSLVWVVPIVAALIGGWLVVKALSEKGPEITIFFKSAESLEAGKTKVKYKDVDIGLVTDISFDKDFSRVRVKVQMDKDAARLVSTSTRFWVVRARVSMAAVTRHRHRVLGGLHHPRSRQARRQDAGVHRPGGAPGRSPAACRASTSSSRRRRWGRSRSGRRSTSGRSGSGRWWRVALADDGSKVIVQDLRARPSRPLRAHRHPLLERERDRLPGRRDRPHRGHRVGHLDPVRRDRLRPGRPDAGARRAGRRGHQLRALRQPRPRPRSGSTPNAATGCCTSTRTWAA
ncbi:MAG: MlaD family protein [Rhodopseudomonas palustris]|nr:MlaD family protein [Rhodopseudomonas palustris]